PVARRVRRPAAVSLSEDRPSRRVAGGARPVRRTAGPGSGGAAARHRFRGIGPAQPLPADALQAGAGPRTRHRRGLRVLPRGVWAAGQRPDREKPVTSLHQFARDQGAVFQEIAPAGEPFAIAPPKIIGAGDDRPMEGVSRAIFVACLIDARVRARSGMIETEAVALLDYQGDELARDGARLD